MGAGCGQKAASQVSPTLSVPPASSLDDVTADWLQSAFRESGLLRETTTTIKSLISRKLGSDEGMLGDKLLVEDIVYAETCSGPTSCLVKIPPSAKEFPRPFLNARCKTECFFYKSLAPQLRERFGVQSPKCYYVGVDDTNPDDPFSHRYVCVLEHMTHAERPGGPMRAGKMIDGDVPLECALVAVQQLAALHAAFWEMDVKAFRAASLHAGGTFPPEVYHSADPGRTTQSCSVLRSGCKVVSELFGEGNTLPADPAYDGFRLLGQCMSTMHPKVHRKLNVFAKRIEACPKALTHGDTTCENLFYSSSSSASSSNAVWIDFQGINHSAALRDVAWFATSSFSVERRRAVEKQLVQRYYDALAEKIGPNPGDGAAGDGPQRRIYESFEQCFEDYRFCLHYILSTLLGMSMMRWKPLLAEKKGIFSEQIFEDGFEELQRELHKSNAFCARVVTAIEDHGWAEFFCHGEEDTEEQNPLDLAQPCNFG